MRSPLAVLGIIIALIGGALTAVGPVLALDGTAAAGRLPVLAAERATSAATAAIGRLPSLGSPARSPVVRPAAEVTDAAAAWTIAKGRIRGLVVLRHRGADLLLSYQLLGLGERLPYRLVASDRACGGGTRAVFSRAFRSSAKGSAWSTATVAGDPARVVSVRLRDGRSGSTIACAGTPAIALASSAYGVPCSAPGRVRCLVAANEAPTSTRILATLSGLRPGGRYQLIGRTGTCETVGARRWRMTFTADPDGTSVRDLVASAGAAPGGMATAGPAPAAGPVTLAVRATAGAMPAATSATGTVRLLDLDLGTTVLCAATA